MSKTVITSAVKEALRTSISENPLNISAACRVVSKKYKLNPGTLNNYYHKTLKKESALYITHTSNGKVLINTKTSRTSLENTKRFVTLKTPLAIGSLSVETKAELFDLILNP